MKNLNEDRCFLFYNATFFTLDENDTMVEAILVIDGIIKNRGTRAELLRFWRENFQTNNYSLKEINLQQTYVYPGFIDAHLHPITCILNKTYFDCSKLSSLGQFKEELRKFAAAKANSEWVIGIKFNEQQFHNPQEKIFPTRYILDEIDTQHPILVYRYDLHIVFLNSRALELLRIESHSANFPSDFHGEIKVDSQGIPTGLLTEDAMKLVENIMPQPEKLILEKVMREFSMELASHGITAIGGVVSDFDLDTWKSLQYLKDMQQDIALYVNVKDPLLFFQLRDELEQNFQLLSHHLKIQGLKRFMDGSFGAKTAWLFEPYTNLSSNSGFCATDLQLLGEEIEWAAKNNIDVMVHAIGDRANTELVNLIEKHWKIEPKIDFSEKKMKEVEKFPQKNPRIRIEHASMLSLATIKKMAQINIIPVCQPEFLRSESNWLVNFIGESRLNITYPFRDLLNHGLKLAGSSDAPVESVNILQAIKDCVVRYKINPNQEISIKEALTLYTRNAAWAIHQEHIRGTLEIGKFADFVLLNQNLFTIDPYNFDSLEIQQTYKNGRRIYPPLNFKG
ncbi:MAG: hypothetical protein DRO88_04820 [Promethearchaeia archaeon]|nr:MAG: hypothetical protein DRO88_04820 [Candidatus Lokiarchaeia archaeon]